MGMVDSFHDEGSKCPKCNAPVKDWQTKKLRSLGEHWKKGDFLQYLKWEPLSRRDIKRIKKEGLPAPVSRTSKQYLSDAPLLFNGKVPIHTFCRKCGAWLEAYAKIVAGKFVGVVEAEANVRPKMMVLIPAKATAQSLREEFRERLLHLQESCKHEKKKWMTMESAPSHFAGKALVCRKCEKVLESKKVTVRLQSSKVSRALEIDRRFAGKHVAIIGDRIVASGRSPLDVYKSAKKSYPNASPYSHTIP